MKSWLIFLFISFLLFAIVTVDTNNFNTVQAATTYSGILSTDTTWTRENSPYNLDGNVLISDETTLTIQSGTTVNLNGYYIMVNGTLNARGSSANRINLNGGQIIFTQSSTDWNEQSGSGCIIEYAVLSEASDSVLLISNSPKICNNAISGFIEVQRGSNKMPIISNNDITGGLGVSGAPLIIDNHIFGTVALHCANATVRGNTISGGGIEATTCFWSDQDPDAWWNCTSLIEENLIINSAYGIQISESQGSKPISPIIRNNTLTNNLIGVYLTWIGLSGPTPEIINNNIYSNINYNLKSSIPNDVNATYNWWGLTDASAIDKTIYDFQDDFNLGHVTYSPFLTAANPSAPTVPSSTTEPTILPSDTLSPSPTSSAGTPTPSSSDLSSASPLETPDPNIFQIQSNSTLTDVTFNSQKSELCFSVSGTAETTGTTTITIAKSYLESIDKVKIFIDGNQIDFEVSQTDASWILTFSYTHSTHQVIIALNAPPETVDFFGLPIGWAVAVVAVVIVFVSLAIILLRRRSKTNAAPI